jgi:porin
MPVRDYESVIELTYQMQLAQNWSVQPSVQYVAHPGGHVPDPRDLTGSIATRDAVVLGIRSILKF